MKHVMPEKVLTRNLNSWIPQQNLHEDSDTNVFHSRKFLFLEEQDDEQPLHSRHLLRVLPKQITQVCAFVDSFLLFYGVAY